MKIIIIIFLSFFLTGCYNYHELNTVGITSAILFDYENDEYKATVQISGSDSVNITEGNGKNVSEALNQAELVFDKKLSLYHLQTVFVTPNVNIEDVLLYLIRNPRINTSFFIVYTEDKDLIKNNKDEDIGEVINNMLKKEIDYTFFDISSTVFNDNIDFYLPVIDDELKIAGMMPYSKFDATKIIDLKDMDTFKILDNKIDSYISAKCGDGFIEFNVNNVDTKFKVNDSFEINIDMEVSIIEYESDIKNYDYEGLKKIESNINQEIGEIISNFVKNLKDNNTDILGLNRYIYNKKHNLDKDFKAYDYKINVNSKINKKGLILE